MSQKTKAWYEARYKTLITCRCGICSEIFVRPPSEAVKAKYCSQDCRSAAARLRVGEKNKHWRGATRKKCEVCGSPVRTKRRGTRFCSRECFWVSGATPYGRTDESGAALRGTVDANQDDIVRALKGAGIGVESLAHVQFGAPDLLAANKEKTVLLEVKNPKTWYGRSGLSRMQQKFADFWQGELYIVTTPEEALSVFGIGDAPKPKDLSGWANKAWSMDRLGRV